MFVYNIRRRIPMITIINVISFLCLLVRIVLVDAYTEMAAIVHCVQSTMNRQDNERMFKTWKTIGTQSTSNKDD